MFLVINEWLLEYSIPISYCNYSADLQAFISKFYLSNSKMVVGKGTPFTNKFYRFFKQYECDLEFKNRYRKLYDLLFRDSTRTILLENYEIVKVSDELMQGIHNDDRYLLELAATVPGSIIVSTDQRLIDALLNKGYKNIIHLKEYLDDKNAS
jgi:hypothetical protein